MFASKEANLSGLILEMTLLALKGEVSSFCKVWILCVSNPQANKAMPGPNALKLPREPVSGLLGMDPRANQSITDTVCVASGFLLAMLLTPPPPGEDYFKPGPPNIYRVKDRVLRKLGNRDDQITIRNRGFYHI
jgi:hypothetical protein